MKPKATFQAFSLTVSSHTVIPVNHNTITMAKVFCITNQKGGVGKTPMCSCLSIPTGGSQTKDSFYKAISPKQTQSLIPAS